MIIEKTQPDMLIEKAQLDMEKTQQDMIMEKAPKHMLIELEEIQLDMETVQQDMIMEKTLLGGKAPQDRCVKKVQLNIIMEKALYMIGAEQLDMGVQLDMIVKKVQLMEKALNMIGDPEELP